MSGNWKITNRDGGPGPWSLITDLIGGPYEYTVQNTDTGEEKKVSAWDENDLGERIARGQFDEDD